MVEIEIEKSSSNIYLYGSIWSKDRKNNVENNLNGDDI